MTPEYSANAAASAPLDAETAARNRLVISLLLISAFVVILNETIMSVAIPHLMDDLGITASAAQWLTSAFMLTMAVVIPVTGFMLQRLNTRPVFLTAMTTFCTGTLICGFAPGFEVLLMGRVVQAVGTAIMMPLLMTTVMTLVPPHARGKTMGNISIVMSVAPAIGPTISGIILSTLDWRWMFWLVLPIALVALGLGAARVRNVSTPRYAPLDVISVVLSALGFGGLVYGLSSIGEASHAAPLVPVWVPLVVGVVSLVLFVTRQLSLQKRDGALLDLRTFTFSTFAISAAMMAVAMMAMFGTFILLPIYTQNVMGLDALATGMLMLPGGLLMGFLAPFVGRLYDRVGPTRLLVPGTIIVSGVLWALSTADQNTSVVWVLCVHLVFSVGLALIFTPLFTSALGSLPRHLYSHGSAVVGTVQQVMGAAGIALFVSLMTLRAESAALAGADQVSAVADGVQLAFKVGASIAMLAIVAAAFVRRPNDRPGHPGSAPHGAGAPAQ